MSENFSAYPFPPSSQIDNGKSPNTAEEGNGTTVISAKFSDRSILTVHMVADKLLSDCWSKGCEFARNFNAPQIEIDHLLLGASHVRDAESSLSTACNNIEELTHQLGHLCARRSFAQTPRENTAYEPSQALKVLFCQAAAIAAKKNVPNLTLGLLIEALGETTPRPAALDLLPKLQSQIEIRSTAEAVNTPALEELGEKVEAIGNRINGLSDIISDTVAARITSSIGAQQNLGQWIERIANSCRQNAEQIQYLVGLITNQPRYDPANPGEPSAPTLKLATADQLHKIIQMLPGAIASLKNETFQHQTARQVQPSRFSKLFRSAPQINDC